jgi:hypothetical protein
MKLAPERLEVEITYRIPEPVMNGVVAGARFAAEKKTRSSAWTREVPFRLDSRRDLRRRARPTPLAVTPTTVAERAEVAGSERGKALRAA